MIGRVLIIVGVLLGASSAYAQTALEWREPYSRWVKSWLMEFYNKDYVEQYDKNIDWAESPFEIATSNIRGNIGNPAIFVRWNYDSGYCGSGGCRIDIWVDMGDPDYVLLGSWLGHDIEIGDTQHLGLKDIWLNGTLRLRWNGIRYES
jgi:hypothetical protein